MSLTDLWTGDRSQLEGKQIHQIITFAGDGKLRDGSTASQDFREFLGHIPSSLLTQYLNQCLSESFKDSGLALQDIVNEIGRRLGFQVTDGRYRGSVGYVGCDGIWRFPKGHTVTRLLCFAFRPVNTRRFWRQQCRKLRGFSAWTPLYLADESQIWTISPGMGEPKYNSRAVIVEVKTTDVYPIDLDKLAKYRRDLVTGGEISEDESSVLIVIGRQDRDTTGVEAQIRGSRHAWDIRLISVDALVRLMSLKEEVEDPQIIRRISEILIPREFTKLDEIIELVFSTAEDIKEEQPGEEPDETESHDKTNGAVVRVAFYDACLKHIEQRLKVSLIKRSRTIITAQS
jgi:hypothetical protein